ncbi:DUF2304 domain-containing protein [Candidatus Woesearchaeota archaeon]|nr:DUF2304 domain-containing protein [Candidatus Woesearchaeota archaeon]
MEILGIQLAGVIFGIIFIYLTYINYKRSELNGSESIFWFILWFGLVLASIFPDVMDFFVKDVLNIGRTLDFLIIISFMVLFGIVFYIFTTTKKTRNKVENLVRNLAIKEGSRISNKTKK